jgi:two-component system cell cycle sensor histidine kinase/response regulator CckA
MGTRQQAVSRDELAITLFEESGDALFLFDPKKEAMLDANPMAERLTGFSCEELLAMEVTYLFRSPVQGNLQRLRNAFKVTGLFHSQEDFLLRHKKDGAWIPVNLTVTRLHCRKGTLGLITARDISERRRLEDRVMRLAAIVGSSEDAIIGTTLDGAITDWNAGAERLYGYPAHEIMGKCLSVLAPHRSAEVFRSLERISAGECVPTFDTVHRCKDGAFVDVAVTLSPIHDRHDKIIGAAAIAQGISSRRRLEEELLQSQKMEAVGRLAGGVAHDFNNLLTVINGYADILLHDPGLDELTRSSIEEIHKAGTRSAALTAQLLAFSRRQVLEPRLLNLNDRVKSVEQLLSRLIGEDVVLTTRLDAKLGQVKVDPGQMDQVLINLAVNARDAMPQGGKLTIATSTVDVDERDTTGQVRICPGRYVLLSINDTGIGMDEKTKACIFEPFFTTKGPGKGTGLGLAVVHGIISQSGGHIDVTSEPGRGATFKIYLPCIEEATKTDKPLSGIRPSPHGTETILLAEDEVGVRRLARHALELAGYRVLEAGDGIEALSVAENHPGRIDLLVTDVVMPEMGGRQLADHLTVVRPGIKVLFLSGYTDDTVVRHGVLGSEIDFLTKPFTASVLTARVREVLDQPASVELTLG